ncbi:MAG: hypothetical protein QNJ46_28540 [Leptolyngbyaceae cyanobacterium MO_188.B28]|nr:hypothetical protein [Leptolyngbyaceae cyanobacterium MO_188.B28]
MEDVAPSPSVVSKLPHALDENALREKELVLKERELALKEQETKARIELEKRGIWFSSPVLIGVASAIFGLIGTGVGAALQGYSNFNLERQKFESNFQLERQKFEFALIQKTLESSDRKEAAKQLLFLVDSGLIQSLDSEKIRKSAANPDQLPTFLPLPAVEEELQSIQRMMREQESSGQPR